LVPVVGTQNSRSNRRYFSARPGFLIAGGFHAIMKKLMDAVERSPDRLIADAKEKSKKGPGKKLPGHQKAPKLLEEVGD
jgi:hypothetical protein